MFSFPSYMLGASLAHRLDPKLSHFLTGILSVMQYYSRRHSRRNVLSNLRLVSGEGVDGRELQHLTRNVFRNFGLSIYYFLRFPKPPLDKLGELCEYDGIDIEVDRLRRRSGFILAGPHVGPWETGGACLSALGVEIHTVALDHPSAGVTRFFDRQRGRAGISCYPIRGSFPALSRALTEGKAVALLVDRTYEKSPRTFPMFGRRAALPVGHAALAVRCRVPILMVACVFAAGGKLRFVFNGPHYPDLSLSEDLAVEEIHARCRRDMESLIRRFPDQWFNFRPFAEVTS
jgi:KDO2-lipid IV(A) lauroyltransferase